MSGIDDLRDERLKKLELLREARMDPYPADSKRTHEIGAVLASFDSLEKEQTKVTIAGRIMSRRGQGGIVFVDLVDGTGRMQVLVKKDGLDEKLFTLFSDAVDVSDFIEFSGPAFVTKRGEQSILAEDWRMLAKSLRQVPDEWFGIKDEDERYRKRYLDILLNSELAEMVKRRSQFWNTTRQFLLERNFVEVETPILETVTGGAEARPFVTHHNALDIDVYLRISAGELWQKKLMVAGLPKVFEIGRIFRNEGMSAEHLQDYTQLEFYQAYSDYNEGMAMIRDLYRSIADNVFGTQSFIIGAHTVDLASEWGIVDFNEMILKEYNLDPRDTDLKAVHGALEEAGIQFNPKEVDVGRGVDLLWKKIRKTVAGPAFLINVPVYLEPLAKKSRADDRVVERFQVILAGSEMGKGFSELNDPVDQHERFMHQQSLRDAGDEEAQMADHEYVEALEYGMPPTFGFGMSERLFSFLSGKSVREAQIFPLMRPRE